MTSIAQPETIGHSGQRKLIDVNWDPVTRIVGNLGIYTKIDFERKEVAECYTTSSMFRGYSVFMKGKDPRDAHFISSRICGICGDSHATCAVYAQNMAFGISTPRMGEWILNLGEAAEYTFDHCLFQENLVGADFCEQAMADVYAGRTQTWADFKVPDEALGCGFHEATRGVLSHHLVIRDGLIANYHPYPPTPWNASPRDVYGTRGPYEDAVQNTPIFEENGPDDFKGVDIMRAVRSFDPCLPCGVHMFLGHGKLLKTLSGICY